MAATFKITATATTKLISRLRDFTKHSANCSRTSLVVSSSITLRNITSTSATKKKKKNKKQKLAAAVAAAKSSPAVGLVKEKRRTRSDKEFDKEAIQRYGDNNPSHVPVMLAEVLDVFSSSCWKPLHSFVDCTLGAGGHSSAVSRSLSC